MIRVYMDRGDYCFRVIKGSVSTDVVRLNDWRAFAQSLKTTMEYENALINGTNDISDTHPVHTIKDRRNESI